MRLYLFRHAIARAHSASDYERPLSEEGKKQAKLVSEGLKRLRIPVDLVITSTYLRAVETGQQVSKALGSNILVKQLDALGPEARPKDASQALGALASYEHIVFVGHEPQLNTWLGVLVAGADILRADLKKASVACVEIEQVPPQVHKGTLKWLMTSEQLVLIGKSA